MHNVQNAMFAAAMAFSMGLKLEDIRHGLRTFDTTFFQAPGRMNVFDEHPLQGDPRLRPQPGRGRGDVPAGRAARGRRAGGSWCWPRRATGGTRTSREIGRIAAGQFDRYICRRDDSAAGPAAATRCPSCCGRRCWRTGVPAEQILVIPDEQEAVDAALREAQRGRPAADLRRRDHPELEADHPLPPRRRAARAAEPPARPRARKSPPPGPRAELPDAEQLVRDERGVRLAAGGRRLMVLPDTVRDSRRLTGPNLLLDRPGAVLEVELADESADALVGYWQRGGAPRCSTPWAGAPNRWRSVASRAAPASRSPPRSTPSTPPPK